MTLTPISRKRKTLFRLLPLLFLILPVLSGSLFAQTVVPFMGLGNYQAFDNNGKPLTAGVLYSFQAGTSTQQATYTDSTGATLNPNPIPFGSGARVQIWLSTGKYYKFVLCAQNDGAACSPGDVLFSVDQVPASASGSGSTGSPFVSGSANPATSGILRLANGDTICWRNAAGSANLCLTTDTSDVLTWLGGAIKFQEIACANSGVGFDYFCADSAAHRWKMANNGGAQLQIVAAGQDINTFDFVTQLHFGGTPTPLSATPPTTSQTICWNGTNIVGCSGDYAINLTGQNNNCATQTFTTPSANGFYRFTGYQVITTAAGTSSTTPTFQINYLDADTSTGTPFGMGVDSSNTVGRVLLFTVGFYAKAGTPITVSCINYTSVPANAMQYAFHARLEGPF